MVASALRGVPVGPRWVPLVTGFPKTFWFDHEIKHIPMSNALVETGAMESLYFIVMAPAKIYATTKVMICSPTHFFKGR